MEKPKVTCIKCKECGISFDEQCGICPNCGTDPDAKWSAVYSEMDMKFAIWRCFACGLVIGFVAGMNF